MLSENGVIWIPLTGSMRPAYCPTERSLKGRAGLRKLLLDHSDEFISTVSEKLLMYAIGRNLQYYDAPAVRGITREASRNRNTFSALVLGVVKEHSVSDAADAKVRRQPCSSRRNRFPGGHSSEVQALPSRCHFWMPWFLLSPHNPAKSTPRLGFIYFANGVIQNQWKPSTTGHGFELPPTLKPLAPVKDQINVISGLAHLQADTFGDGTGDHPRASAAWLTGVHAYDRTQPGIEVRLATTADQIAAKVIGRDSHVASLELTVDFPTQGSCDSGDCFYVNTVSWRNPTTPNPAETHPRIVFERLFGTGGSAAQRRAQAKDRGSILDSVIAEVNSLSKTLGRGDRTKLDEYLDSVREIETRIQNTESQAASSMQLPDRPVDVPDSFDEYTKMMLDLVALGYQADVTRVFSMIFARELSSRTFASIGVGEQHHAVSHHRNDAGLDCEEGED